MREPNSESILHAVNWRRIVLDEGMHAKISDQHFANSKAHIIREPSKSFAKSVCALKAERRWAVRGEYH